MSSLKGLQEKRLDYMPTPVDKERADIECGVYNFGVNLLIDEWMKRTYMAQRFLDEKQAEEVIHELMERVRYAVDNFIIDFNAVN